MDLLAGAFIEPSGGGFDFYVLAQGVGFGVEVLDQDSQAVFAVLQDVLEATAPAGGVWVMTPRSVWRRPGRSY